MVDVFFAKLSTFASIVDLAKYLSPQEQEKLAQINSDFGKKKFAVGRYLIRSQLAKLLGCAANEVELEITKNGRIELKDRSLSFNLSHSKDVAILAISNQRQVGIDVELIRKKDFLLIAKNFFKANELEILKNAKNEDEQAKLFYYFWTAKEAVVKCEGGSIFDRKNQPQFDFDFSKQKIISHLEQFHLEFFTPQPSYIAALAWKK